MADGVTALPTPRPIAPGIVRFYNFLPSDATFLEDVVAGLSRTPKGIPPKYFYDEQGCRLFERICGLPEYYLTRTEMAILREQAADIALFTGPDVQLIEFGSGAEEKTRVLIEALQPSLYMPVDIAGETLRSASRELSAAYPWLNIAGLCADYSRPLSLPEFVGLPIRKKVVFFPGSTVGNFTPAEALVFLRQARRVAGTGGILLIGVDLKKDKALLDAAYDDPAGVTAEFNLNLLERINRELGADFHPHRFRHKAYYDPDLGRVEMHLESLYSQFVNVAGHRFAFGAGETIHTEISCKYSVEEFRDLGRRAGFSPEKLWCDPAQLFSVHGMMAV